MNHRRIRNIFTAAAMLCVTAAGVASAMPYIP